MTSRAKRLLEAGLRVALGESHETVALSTTDLAAIAAMIDAALPEKRESQPRENSKDFLEGRKAYDTLHSLAADAVQWEPHTSGQIAALGKAARSQPDPETDAALVAAWLRLGGLEWMREKATMAYVSRNYLDMVARARAAGEKKQPESSDALETFRASRQR